MSLKRLFNSVPAPAERDDSATRAAAMAGAPASPAQRLSKSDSSGAERRRSHLRPSGARTQGARIAALFGRVRTQQRAVSAVASVVAVLGAGAFLSAAQAQANEPWWGIEVGARPTTLWSPADESEIQEVRTEWGSYEGSEFFAATVQAGGEPIGCLGGGELVALGGLLHVSPDQLCEALPGGFPATETAAGFAEMLEAAPAYAPGVRVDGGPVGQAPFTVTTPGRWPAVPADSVKLTPGVREVVGNAVTLGAASSRVISEDSGRLVLTVTNLGDAGADGAADPIVVEDRLPPGITAYKAEAFAGYHDASGPVGCSVGDGSQVTCALEGGLPAFEAIEVEVFALVDPPAVHGAGTITVSGGGAPTKTAPQVPRVGPGAVRFGIQSFSMGAEEEGGVDARGEGLARGAGSHPFQLTTSLQLNSGPVIAGFDDHVKLLVDQPAPPRNFRFPLPAGLVGNPGPIPTCALADFVVHDENLANECPAASAIGVASVTLAQPGSIGSLNFARLAVPIFNLPPAYGEPARFGFLVGGVPVTIDTALEPGSPYRITAFVSDASELAIVLGTTATFWGNPGDHAHDGQRGWGCVYYAHPGAARPAPNAPRK